MRLSLFVFRYAEEFNQVESANVLKKFLHEIERRNSASERANDPNYHGNDEDLSLPPLGPAFTQIILVYMMIQKQFNTQYQW